MQKTLFAAVAAVILTASPALACTTSPSSAQIRTTAGASCSLKIDKAGQITRLTCSKSPASVSAPALTLARGALEKGEAKMRGPSFFLRGVYARDAFGGVILRLTSAGKVANAEAFSGTIAYACR
jgi:hypothetical protein